MIERTTDAPLPTRSEPSEGLGDWGPQFPFYQGSRWQDYIRDGGLVKEVPSSGFGSNIAQALAFLANQPKGALFVGGAQSAIQQIPRSHYAGSPTDIPQGFYKANTRLTVVKPDYVDGTVTRYTFRLRPLKEALVEEYNPRFIQAAEDLQDFILSFLPFDALELDEIGVWVLRVQESTVLQAVNPNQGSALDGVDLPTGAAATGGPNLLPILISGAGVLTGSPLLIGSGFLLRILEARRS
jgi:hypothetical protein